MWSLDDSASLYGVENWGNGYFSINSQGNLEVTPRKGNGQSADLVEIIDHINRSEMASFPVLFRFPQILEDRLKEITGAFHTSIEEFEYGGDYQLVYPVKVNQRREVLDYIIQGGQKIDVGLEVGTKAELLAALSMERVPGSLIICNGYKDNDYLKLAIEFGQRNNIIVVVDIFDELFNLIKCCKNMAILPRVGLRVKLFSQGSGRWEKSGGELSKFGLSTTEIVEAIEILSREGMIDNLEMLHFHIGSQITDIRKIKVALNEAARIYAKVKPVAPIQYFNVGGGLGIDYDGTNTSNPASVDYTLQEYANDVVYTLKKVCDEEDVPSPIIVSESGRAIAAYHSFLAFKIIGVKNSKEGRDFTPKEDDPVQIQDMHFDLENMYITNYAEYYHDALHYRNELFDAFNLGNIGLEERARGDMLFWKVCQKAALFAKEDENETEEFENLKRLLSKKYIGNFSLFQSVPDMWGVQQLFPIMPLHRLSEVPTERVTIADITCDSDGEIKSFVGENRDFLSLHHLKSGEDYYLGIFLLGAYQDTLGDYHNLLGSADEVHVLVDENGWSIFDVVEGDRCGDLLKFFNYDPEDCLRGSVSGCQLAGKEKEKVLQDLRRALAGYSYFKNRHSR